VSFSNTIEKMPWNKKMVVARVLKGLTQKQAAEKIGTTQKMIWMWESGRSIPRKMSMKAIARAYEVNSEELFEGLLPK
jgi:transcriptional regulator with XRE-family HTH domain